MTDLEWQESDDCRPDKAGWYPAAICFDADEGSFATALYWTGERWTEEPDNPGWWSNGRFLVLPRRCENKDSAETEAEKGPVS